MFFCTCWKSVITWNLNMFTPDWIGSGLLFYLGLIFPESPNRLKQKRNGTLILKNNKVILTLFHYISCLGYKILSEPVGAIKNYWN
jgi:Cu2+-exporting ATPase